MLQSNLLGVTLNGIQKRGIIKYTSRSRKKYRCNTADSAVYWVLHCFTIRWMMAPVLFAEVSGKYTSWCDRMSNNTQQWEVSCIYSRKYCDPITEYVRSSNKTFHILGNSKCFLPSPKKT